MERWARISRFGGIVPTEINGRDLLDEVTRKVLKFVLQFTIVDLGTLGGTSSEAVDINDSGQVVGRSYAADSYHAFSWTQATGMVDMGTLGELFSDALAVNERGQVVGRAARPAGASPHAFLWTAADGMVDSARSAGCPAPQGASTTAAESSEPVVRRVPRSPNLMGSCGSVGRE